VQPGDKKVSSPSRPKRSKIGDRKGENSLFATFAGGEGEGEKAPNPRSPGKREGLLHFLPD